MQLKTMIFPKEERLISGILETIIITNDIITFTKEEKAREFYSILPQA